MTPEELPWYVLYTKPRNEKKVAERLSAAGYTSIALYKRFVASGATVPRWLKSRCLKATSLFKSKINRRDEVFTFPGTVRYLFWLRRPGQVRQVEIHTIQKWLGEYNHEDIDISAIHARRPCAHHFRPILWRRSRSTGPYSPQGRRSAQRTGHSALACRSPTTIF
jgi:transcriptional antiterminator RfaH